MAAWKQIVIALVVLVVAAGAWVEFYPGAPDILAGWGIDWARQRRCRARPASRAAGSSRDRRRPAAPRS